MNIKFMHSVDRYAGIILCVLFSILNTIKKLFVNTQFPSKRKTFLFIELPEMGISIFCYTIIKKVLRLYPGALIYFLIFEKNKESIQILDIIPKENILTIRSNSFYVFLVDTVNSIIKLRKIGIDVTIDLEIFSRFSAILSFLISSKETAGFYLANVAGLYRGNLLTHKVTYNYYDHISINFLALINSLNENPNYTPLLKKKITDEIELLKIPRNENIVIQVYKKINEINKDINEKSMIFLVNPEGGAIPIRSWPIEHFITLIQMILTIENTYVLITGIESSSQLNQRILQYVNSSRCIDFAGKTTLSELIQLFHISKALITADGGAGHFASLTNIQTIVFFGPETPIMYAPLGDNINVIYNKYNCSPCINAFNYRVTVCKDNKCIKDIKPERVFNLLRKKCSL